MSRASRFFLLLMLSTLPARAVPVPAGGASLEGGLAPVRDEGESRFGEKFLMLSGRARLWAQDAPDPFARHSSLTARAFWRRQNLDTGLLGHELIADTVRVGLNGATISKGGELYLIQFSGGFSQDRETHGVPAWQVNGVGLASYHWTPQAALLYGGGYSYLFGSPIPLPAIGASLNVSEDWRMAALLPFFFQSRHRLSDSSEISVFATAAGQQTRVRTESWQEGTPYPNLNLRRWRAGGAYVNRREGAGPSWGGQAGLEWSRRTEIESAQGVLASSKPQPGFFAMIELSYDFGGSVNEGEMRSGALLYRDLESILPLE